MKWRINEIGKGELGKNGRKDRGLRTNKDRRKDGDERGKNE